MSSLSISKKEEILISRFVNSLSAISLLVCSQMACQCHTDCQIAPSITLHLVDSVSGQSVTTERNAFSSPQSEAAGGASCAEEPSNSLESCSSWQFYLLGDFTIRIQVAGYQPVEVSENIESTGGCCAGAVNPVDETVRLAK